MTSKRRRRHTTGQSSRSRTFLAAFALLILFSALVVSLSNSSPLGSGSTASGMATKFLSALGFAVGLSEAYGNVKDLRMNHMQVVGTHNSYHREVSLPERATIEKLVGNAAQNLYYSHAKFADQLGRQAVRSLEIDVLSDTQGGLYGNPLL